MLTGGALTTTMEDSVLREAVPVFVEFEVAVPRLRPAWW